MPRKRTIKSNVGKDPSFPLDAKREAFCAAICRGLTLKKAHSIAGYEGASEAAAWQLRHSHAVDARITWLLRQRVEAETRSFTRRQKSRGDLLARALQKLDDIMSTDIREVADWRREAVTNADGEVIEIAETMALKDASAISAKAAAAIKSVFTKSGKLRVEMHDTRAAAAEIVKLLTGSDAQPSQTTNITQVNVGAVSATDAAQRIAFLLAAAASKAAPPVMIEAMAVQEF